MELPHCSYHAKGLHISKLWITVSLDILRSKYVLIYYSPCLRLETTLFKDVSGKKRCRLSERGGDRTNFSIKKGTRSKFLNPRTPRSVPYTHSEVRLLCTCSQFWFQFLRGAIWGIISHEHIFIWHLFW